MDQRASSKWLFEVREQCGTRSRMRLRNKPKRLSVPAILSSMYHVLCVCLHAHISFENYSCDRVTQPLTMDMV